MQPLILYSRPGCHLCEKLCAELEPLLRASGAALEIVDVDESPALVQRYGLRIPVLVAGELELSEYPLDRDSVSRYLASL
jgi:thioredoxin-like negative regulator of GroEL